MSEQPVQVYLPVELRRRKSNRTEWWTVTLEKRPDFDRSDFDPFALREDIAAEFGGYVNVLHLRVAHLDTQARTVVCEPTSVAQSKSWPTERMLLGCGWKRCAAPKGVS